MPFTDPNVERATNIGMRNSTGRYRRSAKLCKTNDQGDERFDSVRGKGRFQGTGGKGGVKGGVKESTFSCCAFTLWLRLSKHWQPAHICSVMTVASRRLPWQAEIIMQLMPIAK